MRRTEPAGNEGHSVMPGLSFHISGFSNDTGSIREWPTGAETGRRSSHSEPIQQKGNQSELWSKCKWKFA
ncbi:unnamed protein product [Caretta caretta]